MASNIPTIVSTVRTASQKSKDINFRIQQLKVFYTLLEKHESDICDAIHKDLGRCHKDSYIFELLPIKNDISYFLRSMKSMTKPQKVPGHGIANILDTCEIRYQPLGTVLIIGAWNYPILLLLQPCVAAIAAGNSVVLKPSEVAPNVAEIITTLVTQYCDNDAIKIVNGGVLETTALLKEKFDHIFYTGNGTVGKIVYKAAADQLTPVTLELGGKSPCIVDECVDTDTVAKRISWAKFVNAGQTCIAPDYILVDRKVQDKLIASLKKAITESFGDNPQSSPQYSRIINSKHFERIQNVLNRQVKSNPGSSIFGGIFDSKDLYVSPTVVSGVGMSVDSNPIMEDEIFGPLLPVIPFDNVDEAIAYVNSRDHPLSLYTFSKKSAFNKKVLEETKSGNAMVNDLFLSMTCESLPFGGIGASGLGGGYHGKHGFELFSEKRGVMHRPAGFELLTAIRYPEYGYTEYGFRVLKALMDSWRPKL